MGYYIQTPGHHHGKAAIIAREHGGSVTVVPPPTYDSIPEGKALIAVVDNGPFEAAGFCFNEAEFKEFTDPTDPRRMSYVLIDRDKAEILSGYRKEKHMTGMTFDKAIRILPSHAKACIPGQQNLCELRARVAQQKWRLQEELMEKLGATHSGTFATREAKELDRKIEQLTRFLEATTASEKQ